MDIHGKEHITSLKELALLFLRLGSTAFGGPAAHIAMMEEEVVRRRRWISHDKFLDLLGATNLIPGPNSTEMAIHIGYLRAGWQGLIVAGSCFILPAAIIVLLIAWSYVRFGKALEATGLIYGVKPVIIAVILQAIWGLLRAAVKNSLLAVICLISVLLSFFAVNELLILFAAGGVMAMLQWLKRLQKEKKISLPLLIMGFSAPALSQTTTIVTTTTSFGLWPLFFLFLKVGSVLFGSGYVLLVFLRADLVQRLGWLTEAQLLDATAVGQVTPGPVFTTATFIGYLLGGFSGALIATIGIFLPAFIFVAISSPLIPYLRKSIIVASFLDGVNVASLALMMVITWQLGRLAIIDAITAIMALIGVVLLVRFSLNSTWLVLSGAIIGLLVHT
jgi:chromate transporter